MSVVDKLTNLANGFRNAYGITDKYSLDDMVAGLNGLEAINYIDPKSNVIESYSTDDTEVITNHDCYGVYLGQKIQAGTYYLSADLKGKGTFAMYAFPISDPVGEAHLDVDLTPEWKRYGFSFVADGTKEPFIFIRVNSDHEAKSFDDRNWKLVRIK